MTPKRLFQTIRLMMTRNAVSRAEYLKAKGIFGAIGDNVEYMPRIVPLYANLIRIHNNVSITSNVKFVPHDVSHKVINHWLEETRRSERLTEKIGCIEIMDNVFIGSGSIILYNVHIGPNSIIGAGSIVTRDVPPNSVVAGVPAKVIGTYEDFVNRRISRETSEWDPPECGISVSDETVQKCWKQFYSKRK